MKKNMTIREKAQYLDALADVLDSIDNQINGQCEYSVDDDGNEIYTAPGPDHWRYWKWIALQDVRKAAEELA